MLSLRLDQAVGKHCPNRPNDVKSLHKKLMEIGKIPCYSCSGDMDDTIFKGIEDVQRHFMRIPDGVISVGKRTHNFLSNWSHKKVSANARLPGRLKAAWDWVDPLLPEGTYCSSGFRSADDQRRILQKFFLQTYRSQIISKYGMPKYRLVSADVRQHESDVLQMVRGVGQAIATPGKSKHQQGKAIDLGGPSVIDQKQVEIVKLVARAHPELFSGKVLKERNGCVHFEII